MAILGLLVCAHLPGAMRGIYQRQGVTCSSRQRAEPQARMESLKDGRPLWSGARAKRFSADARCGPPQDRLPPWFGVRTDYVLTMFWTAFRVCLAL